MSDNIALHSQDSPGSGEYEPISLVEDDPRTVDLDSRDITYLKDEWENEVTISTDGSQPKLTVSKKAGIIGLPSKRVLTITPKIETNLLYLLAYTDRIDQQVLSDTSDAGFQVGDSLLTILARLFLQELQRVIRRGLAREFQSKNASQRHLRGQLQLDRQLQRHGPVPLKFECRYEELTIDITLNRVVLAAIKQFVQLLPPSSLRNELIRYREQFGEQVDVSRTPLRDLRDVSISHLTAHYRQLIILSRVILQEQLLRGIDRPEQPFPSLAFDMPSVFEEAVVSAVRANIDTEDYLVTENDLGTLVERIDNEIEPPRGLEPDFIIRKRTGRPTSKEPVVAVGDAKWKDSTTPSRNDLYQLATYQAKFGTPGLLVYPSPTATTQKRYRYDDTVGSDAARGDLMVTQLAIGSIDSYDKFAATIETSLESVIPELLN